MEKVSYEAEELLKVDTKGRVRVSRERREALLAEYDRGGQSAAGFAEWAGIKYPTLMYWLGERRRAQSRRPAGEEQPAALSWVEAVVDDAVGESGAAVSRDGGGARLRIELPGGARMEVGDRMGAGLAAEVLRQLGAGGRC